MAIALVEKGCAHDKVVIDLQAKPDEFCDLYKVASADPSMSATVPLLEADEDGVLIESMVILEYLEDIYASTPSSLSAAQRARARLFATLFPTWLNWFSILRAEEGSEEEASAVAKLREGMRSLNAFLEESDPDGPCKSLLSPLRTGLNI